MFQFYWPWFALLLPLPFLVRRFLPLHREESATELYFPALERLKEAFSPYSMGAKFGNRPFWILLTLAWCAFVVALMQPEIVNRYHQVKNKGYDLMLAVDISISMQALDFSTATKSKSRLEVTKEVVGKFAKGREGDRVGLIVFGESAYLHVPLTLDTTAVSKMLHDTVSGMAGNATAIGDAIGLGVKVLRDRPEGSRVLVLLTDGEDNASSIPPKESIKLAKQYGIRVYTIGIGKSGPVPFPNQMGGYSVAQVTMDEELLKEIATQTGGAYFHAEDQRALESIYSQINRLEKSEANESLLFIREPYFYYPLGFGMVLLLVLSLQQLTFRRATHGAP